MLLSRAQIQRTSQYIETHQENRSLSSNALICFISNYSLLQARKFTSVNSIWSFIHATTRVDCSCWSLHFFQIEYFSECHLYLTPKCHKNLHDLVHQSTWTLVTFVSFIDLSDCVRFGLVLIVKYQYDTSFVLRHYEDDVRNVDFESRTTWIDQSTSRYLYWNLNSTRRENDIYGDQKYTSSLDAEFFNVRS